MSETITVDIARVAALYSGEGDFYMRCCERCIIECECAEKDRVFYGARSLVADLVIAKRNYPGYSKLLGKLQREGQRTPVSICRNGCCLSNGHHRIAALLQLGATIVTAKPNGHCFDPAYHGVQVSPIQLIAA